MHTDTTRTDRPRNDASETRQGAMRPVDEILSLVQQKKPGDEWLWRDRWAD